MKSINKKHNEYIDSISPVSNIDEFCLEVHVTEMCNYSCSYCNLHPMNPHKVIDYEKLFSLNYPNNTRVFLMGGEPTIDRHFFDIVREFNNRGFNNIEVQTNLTFDPKKMISKLRELSLHVKFYASFHMEFSKIRTFISKCRYLQDNNMYGGIHLMWLRKMSHRCERYYNLLARIFSNVSLEPTLPKTPDRDEWDKKTELSAFIEQGLLSYCHRLRPKIKVNGTEMSIGEALYNNYEGRLRGTKCYIPRSGVTFSVNRNRFYYCCFDLVLERPFSLSQFNKGYCVCENNVCCADIEYKKEGFKNS